MFRFENPIYLNLLFVLPVLIALFVAALILKRRAIRKFGDFSIVRDLMPMVSFVRPVVKFALVAVALASLVFVIANPQFGSKMETVKREGIEMIIALDVSNSMMAYDIQPNRLQSAKLAISRLIDKLSNDKIGLIAFAGDAYTQVPITTDLSATKMMLSAINPGMVTKQGTAMGAAIELAAKSFSPQTKENKVLIIITDGENHEDDPVTEAQTAHEQGIIVHTIGMGMPEGSTIPVEEGSADFRRDKDGSVVVTKLDENTLKRVAAAGGGIYVRANNSRTGLNYLLDEINKMEKTELESKTYSEYESRFPFFAALSLILLLLDYVLLERRNKKLMNVKLF